MEQRIALSIMVLRNAQGKAKYITQIRTIWVHLD